MKVLTILIVCLLAACAPETRKDRCLEREVFKECMTLIPKGPERTVYNDWDEVVGECRSLAWWNSQRLVENIKKECR